MPYTRPCPTPQSERLLRAFIALQPQKPQRDALALLSKTLCQGSCARPVRAENIHLTLAFIGDLEQSRALSLKDALSGTTFEPIPAWTLTHLGNFGSILWCAGADLPQISQASISVRDLLRSLKISHDKKRFAAHITLARNFRAPVPTCPIRLPELNLSAPRLLVSERDKTGVLRYRCL
jgi:2'-5' RNA ligase